jgi:hypothetical protein
MRTLRSGPLLLALGVALTGCSQAPTSANKVSESPTKKTLAATTPDTLPASSQVVLTVEGMT